MITDGDGEFARAYRADGPSAFLVRPDGYLAHAQTGATLDSPGLLATLRATFVW